MEMDDLGGPVDEPMPDVTPDVPSFEETVLTFEGVPVTDFEGIIPRIAVEMSNAYKRGTILRLAVEVRVKNVSYEETKEGMVRKHAFGINDISIVSAYDPSQVKENVGGSASGSAGEPTGEDGLEALAALGLSFGTSQSTWPGGLAES